MKHPFGRSTAEDVRDQMIRHDILMVQIGRALAPLVNQMLEDLAGRIPAAAAPSAQEAEG